MVCNAYASYYMNQRQLPHPRKKACLASIICIVAFSLGASLSAVIAANAGTDWQMTVLGVCVSVLLSLHDHVHKDAIEKIKKQRRDQLMKANLGALNFNKKLRAKTQTKMSMSNILVSIDALRQEQNAAVAQAPAAAASAAVAAAGP